MNSASLQVTRLKVADKWGVGSYKHLSPWPKGNLYRYVRRSMGLSQSKIADIFGCSLKAWKYRESTNRHLCIAEILALHELSGLTDSEFMKLLNDIA
jgi:hypothetical protein